MNIKILSSLTSEAENRNNTLSIGTHNGIFDSDEVLACAILCLVNAEKSILILRSRDLKMLNSCDICFDILFYAVNKNSITAWLIKWLENNNFRKIRFHDLRHTHASILLYKGVDVKTISERLGHSDILTILNIYTHIIAEQNQRVSEILDDL